MPRTPSNAWKQPRSPIVLDGEQRVPSFATYPLADALAIALAGTVVLLAYALDQLVSFRSQVSGQCGASCAAGFR